MNPNDKCMPRYCCSIIFILSVVQLHLNSMNNTYYLEPSSIIMFHVSVNTKDYKSKIINQNANNPLDLHNVCE